jgi:hypothetical protein
MPEMGPQDSVQANENSLIERMVLLLSDLAFNPWHLMSWWKVGLVAQTYHELMSDHVSEECIATLLPEAAHNPPPAFQLDPWRHQAILEFDVGTEGLLDELQPQATVLRDQLVEEGCLQRAFCSTSPDYLTNVLLYKSATRTMALRAFDIFRALLSAPECASQREDPEVSLLIPQSYEHIAVLAYYSYIELWHGAPMKPVWLNLILKSVEDGLQCDGLSQQTRINLELLRAKVISKVTQQPGLRISKLEAIKLAGADEKRYRLPLVYSIYSTKAKIAIRDLLQASSGSGDELPRPEFLRLVEALAGLRECRRIESAEARSVYRIARCLAGLAKFVVPDQEISDAFRSLGVIVTIGTPVGFRPAQTELMKIFDKKRPQIVGVWFPQQSSGGYEQIEQRTVKFDIRRIKVRLPDHALLPVISCCLCSCLALLLCASTVPRVLLGVARRNWRLRERAGVAFVGAHQQSQERVHAVGGDAGSCSMHANTAQAASSRHPPFGDRPRRVAASCGVDYRSAVAHRVRDKLSVRGLHQDLVGVAGQASARAGCDDLRRRCSSTPGPTALPCSPGAAKSGAAQPRRKTCEQEQTDDSPERPSDRRSAVHRSQTATRAERHIHGVWAADNEATRVQEQEAGLV